MKKLCSTVFCCLCFFSPQASNCFLQDALKELKQVSIFNQNNREEIYSWIYKKAEQLVDTYNLRETASHNGTQDLTQKKLIYAGQPPQEVQEIIEDIKNNQQYIAIGAHCPHTYLFYGPKGIGKKSTAQTIIEKTSAQSVYINAQTNTTALETIKKIDTKSSQLTTPTILVLDGVDNLTKEQLQQYTQTLDTIKSKYLFVFGLAQNHDSRSNLFEKAVAIQKPDIVQRKAIIEHYLTQTKNTITVNALEKIANLTDSYTAQEIKSLINQAALSAVRQQAHAVTEQHVFNALSEHTRQSN